MKNILKTTAGHHNTNFKCKAWWKRETKQKHNEASFLLEIHGNLCFQNK